MILVKVRNSPDPGGSAPGKARRVEPSKPPPSHGVPGLSVVIVNYGSWPDVDRLVESLIGSPEVASGACEIVVVDNDSPEPAPPQLLRPIDGLRLILRPENGGFSAGVNEGWRHSASPWVLVMNPDVVAGPGFLGDVLDRLGRLGPRVGVVGFGLRNPDGSRQPSVGSFPGLVRTAWEQCLPRDRRKYQPEWRLRPGPVDWVTGACMLVNSRLLVDLGGMDEDFFLYYEEVALSRSARDRGWTTEYDPGVSVVHLRPLQNRAISPKMRVIIRHSKLLYFRKHLPAWQFATLVATVRAEAKVRGPWARWRGRAADARSWRAVDRVARLLAGGAGLGGRAVLGMAESVEEEDAAEDEDAPGQIVPGARQGPRPIHGRSHGTRPSRHRKDGPS